MTKLSLLPSRTVHMVIDMQRVFAEDTAWKIDNLEAILPNIGALASALPERTVFTRFITPHHPEDAAGRWRHYYEQWRQFTGSVMAPGLIEIVEPLSPHVDQARVIDKPGYSAFDVPACQALLTGLRADTILFSGVETDVCVLATLFAALDKGYRAVAVVDALDSSSRAGHLATLQHILPRMPDQVELADTQTVLAALAEATTDTTTRVEKGAGSGTELRR